MAAVHDSKSAVVIGLLTLQSIERTFPILSFA